MRKRCTPWLITCALSAALLLCTLTGKTQLSAQNDWFYVLQNNCNNYLNPGDNDNAGNTYTLDVLIQPLNGQATASGSYISYCPNTNYLGADKFTYMISRGGASDTATVYLTVRQANNSIYTGDADQNGTVEHFDVLAVGLGYNLTGPGRNSGISSLAWQPSSYLSTDPGAADCNGDGIVDSVDITAIRNLYGINYAVNNPYQVDTSPLSPTGLPFYIQPFSGDTVNDGNFLDIAFVLGGGVVNANVYGLAFTLQFDSRFILGDAILFDTAGSWMLQNSSGLFFSTSFQNRAEVEISLCRTDHQGGNGGGPVLIGRLPIDDNIDGIAEAPGTHNLDIQLKKVRLINPYNVAEPVSVQQPNVVVYKTATGIQQPQRNTVRVYPNPATSTFIVSGEPFYQLSITDLAGRTVYSHNYNGATAVTINCGTANLTGGAYLVTTKTANGTFINKLIVEQ